MPNEQFLETLGQLVWRASWQAAVLAVIVFLCVTMLKYRLTPAWRHALWSLVLVRLLLPLAPQTRWSPYNVLSQPQQATAVVPLEPLATENQVDIDPYMDVTPTLDTVLPLPETASQEAPAAPALTPSVEESSIGVPSGEFPSTGTVWNIAVSIWLLGVIGLLLSLVGKLVQLWRASSTWRAVTDPSLLTLAEQCQNRIGLRRKVRLVVAPDNHGPATVGVLRPTIVLPESVLTELNADQLQAILLHEFAHVCRHDVMVQWLMTVARIVHWFNPFAWYALSRMAAEREQACDKRALEVLGSDARQVYGSTVLLLVERLAPTSVHPAVVPFFASNRRLHSRIEAIAHWRPVGRSGRLIAVAVLLLLGVFGLTDAVRTSAQPSSEPATKANTAAAPKPKDNKAAPKAVDVAKPVDAEESKAAEKDSKEPVWPADAEVQGRVLDHQGNPVAGAEVLLLGQEKITVYAHSGNYKQRTSWRAQDGPVPTSVRTDTEGRFAVDHKAGPANRIAVVSENIPLWIVRRGEFSASTDIEVTLPLPGAMVIHCDLPGKSQMQEFNLSLASFDGVIWKADTVIHQGITSPNPGEQLVKNLAPGHYAIERQNDTQTGRSVLVTFCQRQLVAVKSGEPASVHFDFRTGRPVEILVQGLDGESLRYGHVTITYWGPKEYPPLREGGEWRRQMTWFDVLPIKGDGRLTTPPIPEGTYDISLFAVHASTPESDQTSSDFTGHAKLVIPSEGEIAPVKIIAKRVEKPQQMVDPKARRLEVHALDEAGKPIEDFEVRLLPGTSWERAYQGVAKLSDFALQQFHGGDLVVRANGYASTIRPLAAISGPVVTNVTLEGGREIQVRIRDANGKPLDTELTPILSRASERMDAIRPILPYYIERGDQQRYFDDRNLLGLSRTTANDFVVNIGTQSPSPLYLTINEPGLINFCQLEADIAGLAEGIWNVRLPSPASVQLRFEPELNTDESPFATAVYHFSPIAPEGRENAPILVSESFDNNSREVVLRNLAPGRFAILIQTTPSEQSKQAGKPGDGNPGSYYERREVELHEGKNLVVTIRPPQLNVNAWKGTHAATIRVIPFGDTKIEGKAYKVHYQVPHYGQLLVAQGTLNANGKIDLTGIAASGDDPTGGDYRVEIDNKYVDKFRVAENAVSQSFTMQVKPQTGDRAPDGLAVDVESGETVHLSSFQGKLVFLNFWSSRPGPYHLTSYEWTEPGSSLDGNWKDEVALIAINIDDDRKAPQRYIRDRRWTGPRHLWSPVSPDSKDLPDADKQASSIYGVRGFPSAFLINKQGRIVWHGHPLAINLPATIESFLSGNKTVVSAHLQPAPSKPSLSEAQFNALPKLELKDSGDFANIVLKGVVETAKRGDTVPLQLELTMKEGKKPPAIVLCELIHIREPGGRPVVQQSLFLERDSEKLDDKIQVYNGEMTIPKQAKLDKMTLQVFIVYPQRETIVQRPLEVVE